MSLLLWTIYQYDPKTKRGVDLGRVRAATNPRAILKGYTKFKVPAEARRYVGARLVNPPKQEPLSESDKAAARELLSRLRGLMG